MRVHTAFDLLAGRLTQIKVTDCHEGEHLEIFDLQKGDLVVSKGDVSRGVQVPPNLVIGKIISVNKQTSNLFQTAQVQSLVDVSRLERVFVWTINGK